MNIDELNQAFGAIDLVVFKAGQGDLPMIHVHNASADAIVSVYGGQVLSFTPRSTGREMLFLSQLAYFAPGKAIKGGVPICWPWFGADPEGQGRPAHGIARNRMWSVYAVDSSVADRTVITLGFDSDASTLAVWPHAFSMRLHVSVGDTLQLALETTNSGTAPFRLTQALHTYFSIGAIAQTQVDGLDGRRFADKAHGGIAVTQSGPVTFGGEVDSVYADVGPELTIVDAAQNRNIVIRNQGSTTAVVWNPWEAIAKSMADLNDDDYHRFVCVETANAGAEIIDVAPGQTARMVARYSDESR
ncbi:MAG: D-hexose-6-phosphate mutarotase [Gammaproteobacteria bacterium]|nr:D-hexose-6-phosphate mutarotase [Gammaproteobacteria bacterium]MCP5136944.1 D-hexose-6-phosphate mutarotase [Gammaproteobacteria bacterium]